MKWWKKILLLIVPWTVWIIFVPFPIKKVNPEFTSLISAGILIIFGVLLYLRELEIIFFEKIFLLLFMSIFLFISSSAISFGYVSDNFGDPDIITWDNKTRLISNFVFTSLIVGCTVIPMELAYVSYRKKQPKK
ncbi:MAG: hypothetical protein ACPGVD_09475 [Flavobacteriales bacterium]